MLKTQNHVINEPFFSIYPHFHFVTELTVFLRTLSQRPTESVIDDVHFPQQSLSLMYYVYTDNRQVDIMF